MKIFEEPKLQILAFAPKDILTASSDDDNGSSGHDGPEIILPDDPVFKTNQP